MILLGDPVVARKGSEPRDCGGVAQAVAVEETRYRGGLQWAEDDEQAEWMPGAAAVQMGIGQVGTMFHVRWDSGGGLFGGFALALHASSS